LAVARGSRSSLSSIVVAVTISISLGQVFRTLAGWPGPRRDTTMPGRASLSGWPKSSPKSRVSEQHARRLTAWNTEDLEAPEAEAAAARRSGSQNRNAARRSRSVDGHQVMRGGSDRRTSLRRNEKASVRLNDHRRRAGAGTRRKITIRLWISWGKSPVPWRSSPRAGTSCSTDRLLCHA
jgi:hypothetical protein